MCFGFWLFLVVIGQLISFFLIIFNTDLSQITYFLSFPLRTFGPKSYPSIYFYTALPQIRVLADELIISQFIYFYLVIRF